MKPRTLIVVLLLFSSVTLADEELRVTPVVPVADTVTGYSFNGFEGNRGLDPRDGTPRFAVRWIAQRADGQCARDIDGRCQTVSLTLTGADARAVLDQLNTANLATKSLTARAHDLGRDRGVLPTRGAIQGTPGIPTETPTPTGTTTRTPTLTPTAAPTVTRAP